MVFCSKLVMKWKYIKKEKEVYKGSNVLIRFYFFLNYGIDLLNLLK